MFQTHKEVLNYDQCFNIKENRFIRRRRPVRNSGSESALKQGREEGIYELYGSCTACERLCDEDSNDDTGKCRGHLSRSWQCRDCIAGYEIYHKA